MGHQTFALEVDGAEYFGEIRSSFLENKNDFNVEIVSFGWPDKEWAGSPMPGLCKAFTADELVVVQELIIKLVQCGAVSDEKPVVMYEDSEAHFMGKVIFREGWALSIGVDRDEGTL